MLEKNIEVFLDSKDYDVRKTKRARWIDQKCTPDVLAIIADCILEYTGYDTSIEFSIADIWQSDYTKEHVESIFSKPDTRSKSAKNEYDKFFSQPINLFEYSCILNARTHSNKRIFKINNLELLEYISLRESNALNFLLLYTQKVLKDSEIYYLFETFFANQDKDSFKNLKDGFASFTIKHTNINETTECYRIFTKIINPLAFYKKKKGTRKGQISKTTITLDEIRYNRLNWRDELNNKEKTITRKEHENIISKNIQAKANYDIQKAKKLVRRYNDKYNDGFSEVKQESEMNTKATQIHHIFPQSQFPTISDYAENLIAITPNQHYSMAHPNNQTAYIDKNFQYICLLAKTNTIKNDTTQTYSFEKYTFVLDIGLSTNDFGLINDLDFATLINKIDYYYSDFTKYKHLAELNNIL
ncbi:hypothetical protein [Campylobacter insulaenigrae]|uniref:Restriction endonuclease n=1 Tax=Campylobacter insulaenigrae NCTC 12927 TaxID=1031564 RepID=A0A0A8H2G2_9BACT|nr:hypothetical protein [Campylobacter insulaenigrae]AJC87054.1 hypothetical protein CINS_0043 [Campylobacter insulaenigrae NCTC 12927]VEH92592.1 Uncharacterised protein [Campylobacter insulaenigrae]